MDMATITKIKVMMQISKCDECECPIQIESVEDLPVCEECRDIWFEIMGEWMGHE